MSEQRGLYQPGMPLEPTHVVMPTDVYEIERALNEAIKQLNVACDLHEQAGTDVTRERLGELARLVVELDSTLLLARAYWLESPDESGIIEFLDRPQYVERVA